MNRTALSWVLVMVVVLTGVVAAYAGQEQSTTYQVQEGDSLWKIAERFYGDGTKWTVIAEANGIDVKNPRPLQIGEWLSIFVTLQAEQAFQDYVVRIYRHLDSGEESFVVLRNGHRVYSSQAGRFIYEDEKQASLVPMGKDITGNGVPNLVMWEWTGGAHCCFISHVFEIGKKFRAIEKIFAGHTDPLGERVGFMDLDGDSNLEFVMYDWTFAYWRAGFAESPAPKVILRSRDGAYRLAGDLMRKPAPDITQLEERAQQIRETWKTVGPPSDLWGYMLDLVYTGHADLAWLFFEMAWPPGFPGKEEFLSDFRAKLSESPYWPEIQALGD
ncbi:MAG: LysM peptidoglycan-binding domain-containing protein [Candidatus Bipolaricaulia bacterium]